MTNSSIQWLKPEQVEQLRTAAVRERADYLATRDDALLALLYDTGLRRAELAQLRTDHLDLDDGTLRVPGSLRKQPPTGGTARTLTIELDRYPEGKIGTERTLRTYLTNRWKDSEFLFPSRKADRLRGDGVNRVVKRAAREADVRPHGGESGRGRADDVTAHTLRHSVGYRVLRESDGGIYDLQRRLGHESLQTTTRRYAHLDTV
jgi:integrase